MKLGVKHSGKCSGGALLFCVGGWVNGVWWGGWLNEWVGEDLLREATATGL